MDDDIFDGMSGEWFVFEQKCLREGLAADMVEGYQTALKGKSVQLPDGERTVSVGCDFEKCNARIMITYEVENGKVGNVTNVDYSKLSMCWKERR